MPDILQRYSTPLITGLFLVSLVSGVALFFHWEAGWFKGMHEWLSMVLILPFVLHLWKNWRSMTIYFAKPAFAISMVLSLVLALAFVFPGQDGESGRGGPPPMALTHQVLTNSIAAVAPLMGKTPEVLVAQLQAAGFSVTDSTQSLADVAKASSKSEFDVAAILVRPAPAN